MHTCHHHHRTCFQYIYSVILQVLPRCPIAVFQLALNRNNNDDNNNKRELSLLPFYPRAAKTIPTYLARTYSSSSYYYYFEYIMQLAKVLSIKHQVKDLAWIELFFSPSPATGTSINLFLGWSYFTVCKARLQKKKAKKRGLSIYFFPSKKKKKRKEEKKKKGNVAT